MKRTTTRYLIADAVATETTDAYSFDRYGEKNWQRCCRMLEDRGLSAREIEAVMRSKWTRWAGDAAGKDENVTAADLRSFLDSNPREYGIEEIRRLTLETFGDAE